MPKKTLVFEDAEYGDQMRQLWITQAAGKIDFIFMDLIYEFEREFVDNTDIDAIVIAPHQKENVGPIAELVRKEMHPNFKGPVIVATDNNDTKNTLMLAGCDYWCPKKDLSALLKALLGV